MKFIVDRQKLKGKLAQVSHGIAKSSYMAMLGHVLLKAQDEELILRTANLETGVEVSMSVSVEEEGACAVPYERLSKWVSAPLSKDEVKFTLTSRDSLRGQCGRNHSTFKGLYSEDEMPVAKDAAVTATVSAVDLVEAVQAVEWAAMSEKEASTHPERAGILLEVHEDKVRLVALDGFNAALYDVPLVAVGVGRQQVVVNRRSMEAIAGLASGDVQICLGDGFVAFKTEDATVVGTTVEGAFPKYEPHFARAEKGDKVWQVAKAELVRLLRAVGPFAQASYSSPAFVEVELSDVRKAVTINGGTIDVGDCMGSIQASGSGAVALAISPVFIKKAVGSIVGEELTFVLAGPEDPVFLKPSTADRHKIVMMPLSVKEAGGVREERD